VKIAYFSPLPPDRTGIADYSATLLPVLAQFADLTLYTDHPDLVTETLTTQFPIRSTDSFQSSLKSGVDICLYQMGNNSQYHQTIYNKMNQNPGVVTLHDINLHSFYGDLYLKSDLVTEYCREMAFSYGTAGLEHVHNGLKGSHPFDVQKFPLFGRVVRKNLGIVVHSQFAADQIKEQYPEAVIKTIPIVQKDPAHDNQISPSEAKEWLGFSPDTILLASFGYIASSKRIDVVLRAFAKLHGRFPNLRFALVGQVVEGYNLHSLLEELNLNNDIVRVVGFAGNESFDNYLAATDIGINLRYPTLGESSATLLRLLALGKPVLVSNVDSFAELPETAVIKIDIGAEELKQIEDQLTTLINDKSARQVIGSNAAQLVREQHIPDIVAQHYIEFLHAVTGCD